MKKNGFIAMSLVYTFFIVFIVVILSILNFYLDNNAVMKKLSNNIIDRYNSNFDGQTVFNLVDKNIIRPGDYVDYQANDENYRGGKWQILKKDSANIYIISNFIVSKLNAGSYNAANVETLFSAKFVNSNLADGVFPLETSDLWPQYNNYELSSSSNVSKLWNIGNNYFVAASGSSVHTIVPNCRCGNNFYYIGSLTYQTVGDWYTAVCPKVPEVNQNVVDKCSVKYNGIPSDAAQVSGARLVIKLKNDVILIGGIGSYNNPYRVGSIN